ncbi:MAG: biotin--[Clostridia bacterium]|nr:biotin--[acetyl-CoA-carboxylase] ligase [Clostridia bacterium]
MNFEIINLESVSSTNDYLKQLAKGGAKENTVVIANNQTNGKGTKGRSFVSQNGGVYLSVLVKPKLQGFDATLITSATAVAVSDAINEISGKDAQIKWVNDVYLDNKKVSGILCESVIINGEIAFIIVGIGVNLFKPENDFPPEIKDIATYVLELENPEIKEKFIEILINNFFKYFEDLENKSFLQKYRDKNLVTGREITVISSTGERKGRALLIDDNCRLLVEYPDKTLEYLSSGEVSIKT